LGVIKQTEATLRKKKKSDRLYIEEKPEGGKHRIYSIHKGRSEATRGGGTAGREGDHCSKKFLRGVVSYDNKKKKLSGNRSGGGEGFRSWKSTQHFSFGLMKKNTTGPSNREKHNKNEGLRPLKRDDPKFAVRWGSSTLQYGVFESNHGRKGGHKKEQSIGGGGLSTTPEGHHGKESRKFQARSFSLTLFDGCELHRTVSQAQKRGRLRWGVGGWVVAGEGGYKA